MKESDGTSLVERYRLRTDNVASVVQLHVNRCKICRCTFRKCDEGQYLVKLLAVVQANRLRFIFEPLDVS